MTFTDMLNDTMVAPVRKVIKHKVAKPIFHTNCKMLQERLAQALAPFKFTVTTQNAYSQDWHRLFIVNPQGCQIGRITLQNIEDKAKVYYVKQYKPHDYPIDYDDDKIWAVINFYFAGMSVSEEELEYALVEAHIKRREGLEQARNWREANPKKKRKGLEGRNVRHLFSTIMVGRE